MLMFVAQQSDPATQYPRNMEAGPPWFSVVPEPSQSPMPMLLPMDTIIKCRVAKCLFRADSAPWSSVYTSPSWTDVAAATLGCFRPSNALPGDSEAGGLAITLYWLKRKLKVGRESQSTLQWFLYTPTEPPPPPLLIGLKIAHDRPCTRAR